MAEQMTIYRLEDLSMNFWVRDIFSPFPNIAIVNEYPEQLLIVPTISVVNGKLIEDLFEMGNRDTGVRTRRWFIDVFALNVSQRDDFCYKILSETTDGINVYDYNEGFPPSASPSLINHLDVISKQFTPIPSNRSLNENLYYRGQIILITKNDKV